MSPRAGAATVDRGIDVMEAATCETYATWVSIGVQSGRGRDLESGEVLVE